MSEQRFPSGTDIRLPPRTTHAPWDNQRMDRGDGPSFGAMIALVAVVVATVILLFFGIGYGIGRIFL